MEVNTKNIPISAAFLGTVGLKEEVNNGFVATGFDSISSMQQRAIFAAMDGFDVIVSSTFGSNEIAILSLCALQKIDSQLKEVQILVLAPSHETGREIRIYVNGVGRFMKINCQVFSSDTEFKSDVKCIASGCQFVIATPARVARLFYEGKLSFEKLKLFVLCDYDGNISLSYEKVISKISPGVRRIYFVEDISTIPSKYCSDSMKVVLEQNSSDLTFSQYKAIPSLRNRKHEKAYKSIVIAETSPKRVEFDERRVKHFKKCEENDMNRNFDRKSGLPLWEESKETFLEIGIYGGLMRGIKMFGFSDPTPLQKKAIPAISNENELIIEAVTSCGKTVSFAIAIIQQLLTFDRFDQILIIAQHFQASVAISNLIKSLAKFTRVTCIDCGHANEFDSMNEFAENFDRTTNVIVGSPYQIQFLIVKKTFYKKSIKMVVVDDVDKLFDEGFYDHVSNVFQFCEPSVKKVFLCRTMTINVSENVRKIGKNLVKVLMDSDVDVNKFKHYYVDVKQNERKFALLCEIYKILGLNKAIIYCNSDLSAYELQKRLQKQGIRIIEMDTRFSTSFDHKTSSKISAIVVSDNYNGDVDLDVELIINYEFPMFYETYKQRLNGRLSNVKAMVSLVAGFEIKGVACIKNKFNIEVREMKLNKPNQISEKMTTNLILKQF